MNIMRTFARERPEYVRMHLMGMFDTGGLAELTARASNGGQILINDRITVKAGGFTGHADQHAFAGDRVFFSAVPTERSL